MRTILLMTFLCISTTLCGQVDIVYKQGDLDVPPMVEINDSLVSIENYLYKKILWTPEMIENVRVAISFVITKRGEVIEIDLIAIPENCPACTRQLIKVLTTSKKINPGMKDGKSVNSEVKFVFYFKIHR